MLEDNLNAEGSDSFKSDTKSKTTTSDIIHTNKPLNPACLDKLNPSEVKLLINQTPSIKHKDPSENWLQNTSIFKLSSNSLHNSTNSQGSVNDPLNGSSNLANINEYSSRLNSSNTKCKKIENAKPKMEIKANSSPVNLPVPKSYQVTIDSSGKIHMARPGVSLISSNDRGTVTVDKISKDKIDKVQNTVKEVNPIHGENPAPYTVIINHKGMLDTVQTSPNMTCPVSFIFL